MYQNRLAATAIALAAMIGAATPALAQLPTRPAPGTARAAAPRPVQQQVPQQMDTPMSQPGTVEDTTNASSGVAPAGYRLGVGDSVWVKVLGQDLNVTASVAADGTVTLPYLGPVNVQGKTAVDLAKYLTTLLKDGGYYAKPILSVEIVRFNSNYVTVQGHVANTGSQSLDRNYRLSEVIARAGGLREDAAEFIVVRHKDDTSENFDYKKIVQGGLSDDPAVQPGDKIFVPEIEKFYISGQINAPGQYPLHSDMTLRRALAQSGGVTAAGSEKRIKVSRDGKEIKLKMDDPIKPGDVVTVGARLF